MIVYKNASFFLYILLSKARSVAGRAAGSLGFAHENRIHWLCGQASANTVPHAGARASGRSLAQKKESSYFKIEIAAPFI